jgi:hypothetical protein
MRHSYIVKKLAPKLLQVIHHSQEVAYIFNDLLPRNEINAPVLQNVLVYCGANSGNRTHIISLEG